jgi:hypothetical protein
MGFWGFVVDLLGWIMVERGYGPRTEIMDTEHRELPERKDWRWKKVGRMIDTWLIKAMKEWIQSIHSLMFRFYNHPESRSQKRGYPLSIFQPQYLRLTTWTNPLSPIPKIQTRNQQHNELYLRPCMHEKWRTHTLPISQSHLLKKGRAWTLGKNRRWSENLKQAELFSGLFHVYGTGWI